MTIYALLNYAVMVNIIFPFIVFEHPGDLSSVLLMSSILGTSSIAV